MPSIFDSIEHKLHPDHHQENPVTTPQPRVVDSMAAIANEIQSNQLAAQLIEHRAGNLLHPAEVDFIVAMVASTEQVRRQQQYQQQGDGQQVNG